MFGGLFKKKTDEEMIEETLAEMDREFLEPAEAPDVEEAEISLPPSNPRGLEEQAKVLEIEAPEAKGLRSLFNRFRKRKTDRDNTIKPQVTKKTGVNPSGGKLAAAGKAVALITFVGFFGVAYHLMFPSPGSQPPVKKKIDLHSLAGKEEYIFPERILQVNPFVKIKDFNDASLGAKGLPAIPHSAAGLPPTVGSIPVPEIPDRPTPPKEIPSARSNVTVTGIVTGSGGNNIAILSDGTVVAEGETYNDGRIAYIGGDGIQFEDGRIMDY